MNAEILNLVVPMLSEGTVNLLFIYLYKNKRVKESWKSIFFTTTPMLFRDFLKYNV